MIRSAHGRPMVSKAPPGGNGTISRTGRSGYFACAHAARGSSRRRQRRQSRISEGHVAASDPPPRWQLAHELKAIGGPSHAMQGVSDWTIGRCSNRRRALGCRPTVQSGGSHGGAEGRGGDGRRHRHRQGGVAGARQGRLRRGAGRPPRRQARRDREGSRQRQDALGADRRQRSGIDQGAVRPREEGIRPARPAVQQRRHRRARGADGGTAARDLEEGRRHQPDRHVRLHPGGHQDHEGAGRRRAAASSTTARSRRTRRGRAPRPTPRPSTR